MKANSINAVTVVGAIVAIAAFATGAILFTADSDTGMARIGLLMAFFGTIIPSLIAALHAGKAREQTNGSLDARIEAGVYRAQEVRRRVIEQEVAPTTTPEPRAAPERN